jgi:thymidine kinase
MCVLLVPGCAFLPDQPLCSALCADCWPCLCVSVVAPCCSGLFSLRKVQAGPQEVVGGDEAYMATCRRCYLEHGGQLQ